MTACIEIITIAAQGPPGPQGPTGADGAGGGPSFTKVAGEVLSGHRALTVDAAGLAVYADKDTSTLVEVIGVNTAATALGDNVTIYHNEEITHVGWSWTPAAPVFLGTNGALTQVAPSSGFLVIVGVALAATKLLVNPEPPIALV